MTSQTSLSTEPFFWGGVMEVILSCENFEQCDESTKTLKTKLDLLYASKNINKILKNFQDFTEEEINYLNSPVLDEIAATITKKNPLISAFRKEKRLAVEFYLKRGETITRKTVKRIIKRCEKLENFRKIIDLLLPYSDISCAPEEYYGVTIHFTERPSVPPVMFDWFLGNHGDYCFFYITEKVQLTFLEEILKSHCEDGHSDSRISINQVIKIEERERYKKELEAIPVRYGKFNVEKWYCLTVIDARHDVGPDVDLEVVYQSHNTFDWMMDDKIPCSCYEKYLEKKSQFPIEN